MATTTLITGQGYNFINMSLDFAGISTIPGFNGLPIKGITYNTTRDKQFVYENSKHATLLSLGKESTSGTLTLTVDTAFFLRETIFRFGVKSKLFTDIPSVDLTISYINKGKANSVKLKNVNFTTDNNGGAEGDASMPTTLDFICTNVEAGDSITKGILNYTSFLVNEEDNQGAV